MASMQAREAHAYKQTLRGIVVSGETERVQQRGRITHLWWATQCNLCQPMVMADG